ncbi:hypothetical protein JL720_9347 [Aureococcus anophagefferens]|nr:hypothetical protein JL720_9347 [Aureococcus anophagefferens]
MDGEKGEKPQSSGSKFTCISGAQHVIVSRKTLFQVVLLMVAAFVGTINLFKQMSSQLDDWKAAHDLSLEAQKTRITSFKESSEALMLGLDDVRTVLEEKEFQLWEKEGLLEYQEERLDSEDQEVQMALYINMLAQSMLALNLTLPEGLEEQPYYGQERAHTDDAPNDDAIRRRRRLRAKAPLPAGVTARTAPRAGAQRPRGVRAPPF